MDFYGTLFFHNSKENNKLQTLFGTPFQKCLEGTLMTITEDMLDGVSSIRPYAFFKCNSLENVEIPSSVQSIGNYAFYSCTGLENVTIPPGLTNINNYAFSYCSSLENIELPTSLTYLGIHAFSNTALVNLEIPQGLEKIGISAFQFCQNLKKVLIADSVTQIGDSAFSMCLALESMTIYATTPPIVNYVAFSGTPRTLKIYVPSGSVDAYKIANGWRMLASQIEAIPNN